MRSLRGELYPFYLDGDSFRRRLRRDRRRHLFRCSSCAGRPAFRAWRNPMAIRWRCASRSGRGSDGRPVEAEREFRQPHAEGEGGLAAGNKYWSVELLQRSTCWRFQERAVAYKKVTSTA